MGELIAPLFCSMKLVSKRDMLVVKNDGTQIKIKTGDKFELSDEQAKDFIASGWAFKSIENLIIETSEKPQEPKQETPNKSKHKK